MKLEKLKVGKYNPRKTKTDIKSLAADIKAHGLINPITILKDGTIVAGHRRFAALTSLKWKKDVPVVVVSDEIASEVAISENEQRENMHPADTFEAFKKLADEGMAIADISARFGYSELYVSQLLALADVSKKVLKAYRDGNITLEIVKSFTGGFSFEKQNAVLARHIDGEWRVNTAKGIKEVLTERQIDEDDKRIKLIGWDAFEKAGGIVHRDLFGGYPWGEGSDLLNDLVDHAVKLEEAKHMGKGWKFVRFLNDAGYNVLAQYGTIRPTAKPLNKKDQSKLDALKLKQEQDEEFDQALQDHIEELEEKIEYVFSDEDRARSGVLLYLDYDGTIAVEQGRILPEDVKAEKKKEKKASKQKTDIKDDAFPISDDDMVIPNLVDACTEARHNLIELGMSDKNPLIAQIDAALKGAE